MIDSGRGTARAEDAPGTPTHLPPYTSIPRKNRKLVYNSPGCDDVALGVEGEAHDLGGMPAQRVVLSSYTGILGDL